MAAYPDITMTASIEPLTGSRLDVSDSGKVRMVSLGESTAYRFKISHPYVTPADKATLQTFHTTNRTTAVRLSIHGVDYDAYFAGAYSFDADNGIYSTASVELVGSPV